MLTSVTTNTLQWHRIISTNCVAQFGEDSRKQLRVNSSPWGHLAFMPDLMYSVGVGCPCLRARPQDNCWRMLW